MGTVLPALTIFLLTPLVAAALIGLHAVLDDLVCRRWGLFRDEAGFQLAYLLTLQGLALLPLTLSSGSVFGTSLMLGAVLTALWVAGLIRSERDLFVSLSACRTVPVGLLLWLRWPAHARIEQREFLCWALRAADHSVDPLLRWQALRDGCPALRAELARRARGHRWIDDLEVLVAKAPGRAAEVLRDRARKGNLGGLTTGRLLRWLSSPSEGLREAALEAAAAIGSPCLDAAGVTPVRTRARVHG